MRLEPDAKESQATEPRSPTAPGATPPVALAAELTAGAALFGLIGLAQFSVAGQIELFSRPLWLDESLTWIIANDTGFYRAIGAVRSGVDTNPPALYLLLWPLSQLVGGLNEVGLRVVAFAATTLALTGIYAICLRVVGRPAAIAATLAFWANPWVMESAVEARFYAPWLAATAWLAYFQLDAGATEPAPRTIARTVAAIFAATLHWFGLFSVGLLLIGEALRWRVLRTNNDSPGLSRHTLYRILPILFAIALLAACAPFFFGQRAGLSVPTWVSPLTTEQSLARALSAYTTSAGMLVALVAWGVRVATQHREQAPGRPPEATEGQPAPGALFPLACLLAMPLVLYAFSAAIQPSFEVRYFLPALLPLSVVLAAALGHVRDRRVFAALLLALFVLGVDEARTAGKSKRYWSEGLVGLAAALEYGEKNEYWPSESVILFKRRYEFVPLVRIRPDLLSRCRLLDFEGGTSEMIPTLSVYERDTARKVAAYYPALSLAPVAALDAEVSYVIVGATTRGGGGGAELRELAAILPLHDVSRINGPFVLASRRTIPPPVVPH